MKKTILLVPVLILALLFSACSGSSGTSAEQGVQQGKQTCAVDASLSAELANQCKWYSLYANPNIIGYVYLHSQTGALVYEYQVRGKCSSTESLPTSPQQAKWPDGSNTPYILPAPQPDGSYGQSENAIFCFLNDAQGSMIEFNAASWDWTWSQARILWPTPATIVVVPNGK